MVELSVMLIGVRALSDALFCVAVNAVLRFVAALLVLAALCVLRSELTPLVLLGPFIGVVAIWTYLQCQNTPS